MPCQHADTLTEQLHQNMRVTIHRPLTGVWKTDQAIVKKIAETPTTAAQVYEHARVVTDLFHVLTHGTPSAPKYPERLGLDRKVHDELFPIAHFANLYFAASNNVLIRWHLGNQQFDATVEDQRAEPDRTSIRYLEVTTLQNKDDAELLKQLAEKGTTTIEGDHRQADHLRKVDLLRTVLQKKGTIEYPPNTALLVYTDEDRFRQFSFGVTPLAIDKKKIFGAVLHEMKPLLGRFSTVFVYSKSEIYCTLHSRTK